MTEPEIRRIRADEWRELRRLRLRALADAPLAFGSTLAREAAYPDERWIAESAGAAGDEHVTVVAAVGDGWVAMARGFPGREDPRCIWLVGVYVEPEWRGNGLAQAVSDGVVEWARARGADEVRLHVADWNGAARRTYERLGFRPTGVKETLPHDASVIETEMRLRLATSGDNR